MALIPILDNCSSLSISVFLILFPGSHIVSTKTSYRVLLFVFIISRALKADGRVGSVPVSSNDPVNLDNIDQHHSILPHAHWTFLAPGSVFDKGSVAESSQATIVPHSVAAMFYTTVLPTLKSLLPTAALVLNQVT